MTHKIYLIKHLDNGKQYVGITGGDLAKRWQQHYNDPKSAVYKALRTEGYRMTMELLDEVDNRDDALALEQMYIQNLNTAEPHGWNRMVKNEFALKLRNPIKWHTVHVNLPYDSGNGFMVCPACRCEFTHFYGEPVKFEKGKSEGYTFTFWCEECHHDGIPSFRQPPHYEIDIYSRTGFTRIDCKYFVKDNK